MPHHSAFEPMIPGELEGELKVVVSDPNGKVPSSRIIHMTDDWCLEITLNLKGDLVPFLSGTWLIDAYVESMGPGPEESVLHVETPIEGHYINGQYSYTKKHPILAGTVPEARPYKLVTVVTSLIAGGGQAGVMAAYDEGPILQFID